MTGTFDNQHPAFPSKTVMKIITDSGSEEHIQARLDEVFDELQLSEREWSKKYSGKNKYVSFSTSVTIQSLEQLHSLYAELNAIPEVRYIL